ncbi:MAG: 50S ribosomal protein L1 [Chloroflexi bacterium]|nr:50S ribosomal protein L1 [Chloroflexota bacterium]MYD65927.1 50S ribosomal protein L1 [Chloroflexota bacterium]
MPKRGKRYRSANERVDADRLYEPEDALSVVREGATAKFDETVELHLRTGLDGRHAEQQIRGSVTLPHGLGREQTVIVFAEGEAVSQALEAGANEAGGDELIQRVADGWTEFDVAIAQRELMGKVGRLGRILGPRGLMPNPRNNTVLDAENIPRAVREGKSGRVEFRLDRTNLVHMALGKASFSDEQLSENLGAIMAEIVKARPADIKGQYIRAATLTSTMGPGVHVDVQPLLALAAET